jgi:hypothetical protein
MKAVHIGSRLVGDGHPAYLVAEVGSNHDQDLDKAFRLIDAAAEAGVDAVKFQTFKASEHYSRRTPGFSYLNNTDTFTLIESLELDRTWQPRLLERANSRGIDFFSSPCDFEALAELDNLGVPVHKLASFDLPDTTLVRAMARSGKPIVLSTGMASWMDIQQALDVMAEESNDQVILLQCTSLYPAPARLANLRAMASMRQAFGTLVGYSDHTMGEHVALAAIALGACFIEKHFTLDRTSAGPDHPFAIEPHELTSMVRHIREVESSLGDGRKTGPRAEEQEMALKGRRSLHARADIPAGKVISDADLSVKRPGLGIMPALRDHVVGRRAARAIEVDEWITWDMLA